MTIFLLEFQGWYWRGGALAAPEFRDAFEAMNEPTTTEEFERGFLTLLRSDDTAARGMALDFYDRAEMTERYVGGNGLEDHAEEVFRVARELLRQPPRRKDEQARIDGANHASALSALWREAMEDEDTGVVIEILERMPEADLRAVALYAADALIECSEAPDPRLSAVKARVEACFERVEEIQELRDSDEDMTERFVRATEDDEWRVRQEAAAALTVARRFYAHRTLLEDLAATWSDDERSTEAEEVREALGEGPHSLNWEDVELDGELLEAHRRVRTPTSEEGHHEAFRALLHSERPEAVGIALDHYHDEDGLTRYGIDDDEYEAEVLAAARVLLGRPSAFGGAEHASAFNILFEHGEPEDAEMIAAMVRARETPPVVRVRAMAAASACLYRWETPDEKVVDALEALIFDRSFDMDHRTQAVNALTGLGPVARITALLNRAARSDELPIQVEGAIGLTFHDLIDEHRPFLKELVASWPQDAGERAEIVRRDVER